MSTAAELRDQIAIALNTIGWLAVNGIKPLNQQAGNFAKPVILIEHSQKCQQLRLRLGAEIVGRGTSEQGCWLRWQAEKNGCLIEWFEVVTP